MISVRAYLIEFTVGFSNLNLIGGCHCIARSLLWAPFAIELDIHYKVGLIRPVGVAKN